MKVSILCEEQSEFIHPQFTTQQQMLHRNLVEIFVNQIIGNIVGILVDEIFTKRRELGQEGATVKFI